MAKYIAGRILRLLALGVWLGGLVFFGAVMAPLAVGVFGLTPQFATFIARSLLSMHAIGLWCGIVMLLALRLLYDRAYKPLWQGGLILLMIVLTYASNRLIILPMEHDRQLAGGNITILLPDSPLRQDFDARHAWSTRVEEVILLAGVGLAVLIGFEAGLRERITTAPPRKVFDLSDDK